MPNDESEKSKTPKTNKSEADKSIAHFRCSKCLNDDCLHLNSSKLIFECTLCGADYLNPCAIGPWDDRVAVVERHNEEVVASYVISTIETETSELNQNYAEFIKSTLGEQDLSKRVVEPDGFLPTQATEQATEKVEASKESE